MKKTTLFLVAFIFVLGLSACGGVSDKNSGQDIQNSVINDEQGQNVLAGTMNISREYTELRLRTDDVLLTASNYSDYETWNDDLVKLIADWEILGETAKNLEELAGNYTEEKVTFILVNTAHAYTNQEISDVFDRAPVGKKIKTLAQFLGVDAKKAFQILKQDQAQVQADAWNEAGDTFQKLESSATAIKSVCKVGVFVGTVVMTGGTAAIAGGSAVSQAAVVVAGADLVLEVTDDAAKIALGNHNKISQIAGDARVITEPLSSVLMISSLPSNMVKGIDKLNAVVFGLDQFNTSAQDGKVIGIKLPAYTSASEQTAKASVLEKDEVNQWITEQGVGDSPETVEEIKKILNIKQKESLEAHLKNVEQKENITNDKENTQINNDNGLDVAGVWEGILTHTPNQAEGEKQISFVVGLNSDATVDPSNNGKAFANWEKIGNVVRLYFKDSPERAYYEFSLSGNTLTFVKMAGPNSEGEWQEDYAGEDFFGGKFYQIILEKQ